MVAPRPPPRLLTGAMAVVAATLFMGALVPNLFVLAPRFLAARGYNEQEIGVIMGSFNVAALIAMLGLGRLADRLGQRVVLVIGCVVGGAGCLVFEAAGDAVGYALARATQGMGFAAVLVASAAYVAEIAPPARLAQALGITGALTLCSQAAGPFLGELVVAGAGWPWVFRSGVVGAAIGAVLGGFLPPVRVESPSSRDPSPAPGWSESAARRQRRQQTLVLLSFTLASFGFGSVWVFIADYTRTVGVDRVTPFFAPYVVAALITRIGFGHLADRLGRRQVAVPALLVHTVALLAMAKLSAAWQLIGIGGLFGIAHGFYYPALQALVIELSAGSRSRAVAASTFAFGLGIVLAAFGLGSLAKASGYPVIYLVAAGSGVAAAVVVGWSREAGPNHT